MSPKISIRVAALAAATFLLSSPLALAEPAHSPQAVQTTDLSCRYVGAISHRCYTFHSDATWPAGLADYHGSNGG
jgi:hypothetical protein